MSTSALKRKLMMSVWLHVCACVCVCVEEDVCMFGCVKEVFVCV